MTISGIEKLTQRHKSTKQWSDMFFFYIRLYLFKVLKIFNFAYKNILERIDKLSDNSAPSAPSCLRVKLILLTFVICLPINISAQYFSTPELLVPLVENAPNIVSRAAVMVDAETGALLYFKNGDDEIPPASLTKLMTMYLVMNEIREGRASYDEIIPITEESWAQRQPLQSSLMFLEPGQIVTLREILLGLAVASGNDAAVAAAFRVTPDMDEFAKLMTMQARRMGLKVTRFAESSGYSSQNMTTANEFAFFCYQYIKLNPDSMKNFHSILEFSYPLEKNVRERRKDSFSTITQTNRNTLLGKFEGVDGLKTGFIPESGYNIALTAKRDQTRFILVLLGAPSQRGGSRIREEDGFRLLSWAFENFKTVSAKTIELDDVQLWKGKEKSVKLALNSEKLIFTSPLDRADELYYETVIDGTLVAPLAKDHPVGCLVISDQFGELHRERLVTAASYEKGNILKNIWHSVVLLFKKILDNIPKHLYS